MENESSLGLSEDSMVNINAITANRIVWAMNSNWPDQFPRDSSDKMRLIVDRLMEQIVRAALKGDNNLSVTWTNDVSPDVLQEVKDFLTNEMGYTVVKYFYGYEDGGFVIKW